MPDNEEAGMWVSLFMAVPLALVFALTHFFWMGGTALASLLVYAISGNLLFAALAFSVRLWRSRD